MHQPPALVAKVFQMTVIGQNDLTGRHCGLWCAHHPIRTSPLIPQNRRIFVQRNPAFQTFAKASNVACGLQHHRAGCVKPAGVMG